MPVCYLLQYAPLHAVLLRTMSYEGGVKYAWEKPESAAHEQNVVPFEKYIERL